MDSSNPETAAAGTAAVVVVGPQYCAPNPVGLVISTTQRKRLKGRYDVRDSDDNLIFQIKTGGFRIGIRNIIEDAAGNPILTLREKGWSFHGRWEVFRGKSTDRKDLVFTVRRSSVFRWRGNLKAYLASNSEKEVCDFNVEENDSDRPCSVYAGESNSDVVARIHRKGGLVEIKEKYAVTVYSNVDQLFIAALFVILHATKIQNIY